MNSLLLKTDQSKKFALFNGLCDKQIFPKCVSMPVTRFRFAITDFKADIPLECPNYFQKFQFFSLLL